MTISTAGIVPEWTLADRLRKARELSGLEAQDFAEEVGISRQSISAAERGRSVPRELTLRAWALRTGVSLEWLKYGTVTVPPDGIEPSTYSLQGQRSGRVHILRPAA